MSNENNISLETTVGYENTYEALREGVVRPLEEANDLEAAVAMVAHNRKLIDDLKDLKKKRVKSIDEAIARAEGQNSFLDQIIIQTLDKDGESTVRFPGVGKVSKRIKKGKWIVEDEESLLDYLSEEEEYDKIVTQVPKVDKKELNKLLDIKEKVDALPECVKREDPETSLTFTFEKESKVVDSDDLSSVSIPQKNANVVI